MWSVGAAGAVEVLKCIGAIAAGVVSPVDDYVHYMDGRLDDCVHRVDRRLDAEVEFR